MPAIAVFGGAFAGKNGIYTVQAYRLGSLIAKQGFDLVFGGGKDGIMGAVADGALAQGGKVIGVLPEFFNPEEVAHPQMHEIIYVKNLQERKEVIRNISDAFISLPGGIGTLDEFFEMIAMNKLNLHLKPSGLLNTEGYFDPLLKMFNRMENEGFLNISNEPLFAIEEKPEQLMEHLLRLMHL